LLIESTQPEDTNLNKKSFSGVSFGSNGIPIETVAFHLLGRLLDDYKILVVDEFVRMKGVSEERVSEGYQKLERFLSACDSIYGPTRRIKTSDFMNSSSYLNLYKKITNTVINNSLFLDLTMESVPMNRFRQETLEHHVHEYTCVKHLTNNGYEIKIGPRSEKVYDRVITKLIPNICFAYLQGTFSLNERKLKEVSPYTTSSKELDQKKHRILIDNDGVEEAKKKLKGSGMIALKFYYDLSSVAYNILTGNAPQNLNEMMMNDLGRYKDTIAEMTAKYVLEPLKGELS